MEAHRACLDVVLFRLRNFSRAGPPSPEGLVVQAAVAEVLGDSKWAKAPPLDEPLPLRRYTDGVPDYSAAAALTRALKAAFAMRLPAGFVLEYSSIAAMTQYFEEACALRQQRQLYQQQTQGTNAAREYLEVRGVTPPRGRVAAPHHAIELACCLPARPLGACT